MSRLSWDATGAHLFETGVDQGVLYPYDADATDPARVYGPGVAWNGLSSVSESPEGADENAIYADNMKYLSLRGIEEFGATIEAYTYPDEWAACDGSGELAASGISIGQQKRKLFGFCFRTKLGNDVDGDSHGYKLHLIYGCTASPSERSYETVNDSPEAITFSWEVSSNPVTVGTIDGEEYRPTSCITVDSTKFTSSEALKAKLAALENMLYGIDAAEFSTTKTYAVGDYVTHTESSVTKTYICKTAITTAGAWDSGKWTEVDAGPYLPLPSVVISTLMAS